MGLRKAEYHSLAAEFPSHLQAYLDWFQELVEFIVWWFLLIFLPSFLIPVESLSGDKTVVMVNVFGTIKFEGNPVKTFSETFFLIKDGTLWRIQSATFRFIE